MKLTFYSFILFSLASLISSSAKALDQATLQQIAKQGMIVIQGELTGAGAKASIHRLHAVIYRDEFKAISLNAIKFSNGQKSTLEDIESIRIESLEIYANELDGFVVKK